MILAIFYLCHPNTSYQVQISCPFCSGEAVQNRFSRWPCGGYIGFLIRTFLANFVLQITQIIPTKFRVNWPYGSEEDTLNRFPRWWPWNNFSYFCHFNAFYQVSSQLAFWFRRRTAKYISKIAAMAAILDILSEPFYLFLIQVTLKLSIKFRVNWPFCSGEEAQNRFPRQRPQWSSWIPNRYNFSYF